MEGETSPREWSLDENFAAWVVEFRAFLERLTTITTDANTPIEIGVTQRSTNNTRKGVILGVIRECLPRERTIVQWRSKRVQVWD
jgi:hypothetical protein